MKTFGDPKEKELYISGLTNLCAAYDDAPCPFPAGRPAQIAATAEAADTGLAPAQDANVIFTIELGNPPFKYLSGMQNETTNVGRPTVYPSQVVVLIDGKPIAQATQVLDLWHQAATQDRIMEKEGAQTGKALAKTALELIGGQQSNWDVSGDMRYWASLRGRTFVCAAKVPAGVHTVTLRMYDINGKVLPRWNNTYYGLSAPATGESCILLSPRYNGDNQLPANQVAKVLKAGATYVEP